MQTSWEGLARRAAVAAAWAATATWAAGARSAAKAAGCATKATTATATAIRALALVATTAATACAALGHHVYAGAHWVGLAARGARYPRLAGEILHGRVSQRIAVLVRTRIVRARGLVFVGHGAVVVTRESGIAGKASVTRRPVRAVAACALARRAVTRAIARAITVSITRAIARPTRTGARATGAFLFAYALQHFGARRFGGSLHHITAGRLACAAPNGLAAHGDGLGALARLGFKAGDDLHFQVLLGKALYVLHKAFFVHAD
jgi:hypothetical protein